MELSIDSRVKLNSGTEIPVFGFGTYQLTGDVESRFRQIRSIIRKRYLIETGQEDTTPDDSFGSL